MFQTTNRCWPKKLKRTWREYVWVVQSPRTNSQVTAPGMAKYCFLCNLHLILLGSKYLFADPIQEAAHCAGKTAHGWINFTFWLEIFNSLCGETPLKTHVHWWLDAIPSCIFNLGDQNQQLLLIKSTCEQFPKALVDQFCWLVRTSIPTMDYIQIRTSKPGG